jgi:TPR repeat protein
LPTQRRQVDAAKRYADGDGVIPDKMTGLKWAGSACNAGSLEGCLLAAELAGAHPNRNMGEVARWSMKAAELGSVDAQARVGEMLLRGISVRQSTEPAVHMLGGLS